MDINFLMNSRIWDYAKMAQTAAMFGGPQKFLNAIYNAGRVAVVSNALILGITVGVTVGVIVGMAAYTGAVNWSSSKRKTKYGDCPECETRLEHRSDFSDDGGFL